MRRAFGVLCMLLGLAMVAGAAWLVLANRAEESAAGDAADQTMTELRAAMEDALTVATLLIKAGYRVQMRKSKEGTAKYMYVLEIAR